METTLRITLALAALAGSLTAGHADAVALYWTKTPVKSDSVKTCLGFASTAMRAEGMSNIRVSPMEVAGTRGGEYAAITCFKTVPRASAIVMVTGDALAPTRQLSEDLQHRIAGVVLFDNSP